MKRAVIFSPEAAADLLELYDYVADNASPNVALAYTERLESYCRGFELFGERGMRQDHIRAGLRTIGFERRVLIAFTIDDRSVVILRLLYGGRDLASALS